MSDDCTDMTEGGGGNSASKKNQTNILVNVYPLQHPTEVGEITKAKRIALLYV